MSPIASFLIGRSGRSRAFRLIIALSTLGQIGGPEAREALEHAALTHPDPATRRRAAAKLRSAEALSVRSDAP